MAAYGNKQWHQQERKHKDIHQQKCPYPNCKLDQVLLKFKKIRLNIVRTSKQVFTKKLTLKILSKLQLHFISNYYGDNIKIPAETGDERAVLEGSGIGSSTFSRKSKILGLIMVSSGILWSVSHVKRDALLKPTLLLIEVFPIPEGAEVNRPEGRPVGRPKGFEWDKFLGSGDVGGEERCLKDRGDFLK